MPIPTTGNTHIDSLLAEVVTKGFSLDSSKAMWKLKDREQNEFGFDPSYSPARPLLGQLLQDAARHGTLCHTGLHPEN